MVNAQQGSVTSDWRYDKGDEFLNAYEINIIGFGTLFTAKLGT